MEKTLITKVIFHLVFEGLKLLVKRTDNKIDDSIINTIDRTFNSN